jgi:hypothetical protein
VRSGRHGRGASEQQIDGEPGHLDLFSLKAQEKGGGLGQEPVPKRSNCEARR